MKHQLRAPSFASGVLLVSNRAPESPALETGRRACAKPRNRTRLRDCTVSVPTVQPCRYAVTRARRAAARRPIAP